MQFKNEEFSLKFITQRMLQSKACALYRRGLSGRTSHRIPEWTCGLPFCFPDTHADWASSTQGIYCTCILYSMMNEMDRVWCEQVFALG